MRSILPQVCAMLLYLFLVNHSAAQCVSNPTYVISGNSSGNYNIGPGQSVVIASSASFTGTINMNGGVLCNQGTIQTSATINANSGTIYNYGVIRQNNFNTPSGLTFYNYNLIFITGNLIINSGSYWYEDGQTTVGNNMQVNGVVTGTSTVCGGFKVSNHTTLNSNGNVSNIDFCDLGMPSGGFDVRNAAVPSSVTYCTCSFSPLPVELVDFTAECNSNTVNVSWSTASEVNNDYFILEKSADAVTWSEITKVAGNGNSNELKTYSYTDHASGLGATYYRLTQVDFNGDTEVFSPKSANCGNGETATLSVYPNPADEYVTVSYSGAGKWARWSIISMSGAVVNTGNLTADGNTQIEVSSLPAGVYTLRVADDSGAVQQTKLLVR